MKSNVHIRLRRVIDDSYDIRIGTSLPQAARDIDRTFPHSLKFIITDSNVEKLYAKSFLKALKGSNTACLVVPAGESSKNLATKQRLEDKILSLRPRRDSLIVALGGGMIGDLAGFVAATMLRGVPFVQIPTTLLAQVDSSIGGKVAVDHPKGKNLIGAFYQPRRVYIDLQTLSTLSDAEFSNGMAEVIKYGAIMDNRLFSYLEKNISSVLGRKSTTLNHIIRRCCELKKFVVQKDEKEEGLRRILNFGHTIGHAVESRTRYRVSHGEAVAIGMVAEGRISAALGLLPRSHLRRLENLIAAYGLPTSIPSSIDKRDVVRLTASDKKAAGKRVYYTLLSAIGRARVGVGLSSQQVLSQL
ncbi:MAG TPA: 3-dehydroquinate synthase [Bacteroidota bacterium]|nr:3-dehydroquinate synthase [Bacteroidota bacterium]